MGLCPGYAGPNPVADQFPFKFRDRGKNTKDETPVGCRSINTLMQTEEINPLGPELLARISKLPQTAGERVVTVDHDAIHRSPPTIGDQLIQRRPVLLRSTDSLIDILTNYGHLSPGAVLRDFLKLHLWVLSVVGARPRVDGSSFHEWPQISFSFGRPPSFAQRESSRRECLRARAMPPRRAQALLCSCVVFAARDRPPSLPSATALGFFSVMKIYYLALSMFVKTQIHSLTASARFWRPVLLRRRWKDGLDPD